MGDRSSQQDQDAIAWHTAGIRLGTAGLDLREPADPGALTRLLNARFLDERSIGQRDGHTGQTVRDNSDLAPLGGGYSVSGNWVFGHGATISSLNAAGWENAHHPFPGVAQHTFTHRGADVVWTGDRLIVPRDENHGGLGASAFWSRASTVKKYGIPAYLPLQTDSNPPAAVSGDYVETCLTARHRVVVQADGALLTAWVLDRDTSAVLDTTEISGASNNPVNPRVVNSADTPVVIWRDGTSRVMYMNYWTGTQWAGASVLQADVYSFDVCPVAGGFYIAWREGSPSTAVAKVGYFSRVTTQSTPFTYGTALSGITPTGVIALDVSPSGQLGILCDATGLQFRVYSDSLSPVTGWTLASAGAGYSGGVSVRARGLRNSGGQYPWVVHLCRSDSVVVILEGNISGGSITFTSTSRHNSKLASKSWRAGDEVFCWLRSACAGTHYLVAGSLPNPEICGYADREEAIERVSSDDNYAVPLVAADPLDPLNLTFTWIRPFNTGQTYDHGGNVRIGDIKMRPEITSCQFGKCVYLSGSAVRCWDGVRLGDAGFQDYPTVSSVAQGTGGGLTALGKHFIRIYAVRYNARGERFQSAALTHGAVELTGSNTKFTATIKTLPSTNHDDVIFECYRTENLGTTFYLEGVVANNLTAGTVTFEFTMSDATLRTQVGDSHAAGVTAISEIEEFGPLGCSVLAVSGDRMWGIGGQVPPGNAQFSKLKEDGEGAGFDALAGFQVVDTEGGEITSIHPLNDTTVTHQARRLFVIAGTGPDNYGRGSFTIPQIMLADGATHHAGYALTQMGAVFWGQDGPRLLDTSFRVTNISAPIRALAKTLTPSGARARLSEHEVVWYTRSGEALLWSYLEGSRWAQWSGLNVAGCSQDALATTDGRLLRQDSKASGDAGQPFAFVWTTGNLRADQVLGGSTNLRSVGLVGKFEGDHRLRFRVYYNGSPLWTDEWIWSPTDKTWLISGGGYAALTPAQIDALGPVDRSGGYLTHKRVSRPGCQFFRVEVSNIEADAPTYVPYELTLELGAKGGPGRVPVNTFSTSIGR